MYRAGTSAREWHCQQEEHSPLWLCLSLACQKAWADICFPTEKWEGNFVQVGFAYWPIIGFLRETKKIQTYNKAYLKICGVLLHVLFMLHFCFADTKSPFSWGEDKEGIPPNTIKTGPILVHVNLSCSQSFWPPRNSWWDGCTTYQRT